MQQIGNTPLDRQTKTTGSKRWSKGAMRLEREKHSSPGGAEGKGSLRRGEFRSGKLYWEKARNQSLQNTED